MSHGVGGLFQRPKHSKQSSLFDRCFFWFLAVMTATTIPKNKSWFISLGSVYLNMHLSWNGKLLSANRFIVNNLIAYVAM
jgi:hypothetical protein